MVVLWPETSRSSHHKESANPERGLTSPEDPLILDFSLQNCYLAANPRFGSLPKVALAGILGYGLGKASYIGVCQSKFHSLDDQLRGAGFGPGHNRHCLLTCEECKIKHGLSEERSSQPSAS
ncbi:OCIA domain-containing protein 2 isoform X1 [Myotis lucifugus]|uniref:OCIA domain-containing protein 2 isoform X1 n=1 Tax=Myotis lucifugus TaxID=59463 RepID=UPI000CCC3723|nr:OCIA domain-containing protein 2 isoform X1 [Myotis lucifugus]